MAKELRFDGRVAIVTGAGGGLGRAHALLLASRGAAVVVNDLGGGASGEGRGSTAADKVVEEIRAAGGTAVASYDSVENGAAIVQTALDAFGRIDVVINNAGILRDVTFAKMTAEDWHLVRRVHLDGAFAVTHAAWPHLRDAGYGRVLFTTSAAGLYGNFGQANYAAAKMGLVGFAQSLALEGKKRGVLVNVIAPLAASRLTESVLPPEVLGALEPGYVSPLVAWLCHEDCAETGGIFEVGGGFFAKTRFARSKGKVFRLGRPIAPERVAEAWPAITSFDGATYPPDVTAAMDPILANVTAGPSRGGNELIDVDAALGYELPEVVTHHTPRDLALYALAVGAGTSPTDPAELALVYEGAGGGLKPLGTFGTIPVLNAIMQLAAEGKTAPGLRYGLDRVLHGEQLLELKKPLPPSGKLTHRARIKDIFDKGKHALVVTETRTTDESGDEVLRAEIVTVVRGAGGFGGERGPSAEAQALPSREPDAVITEATHPSQALLYRLNGDANPLHADPDFAKAFGFDRPILHGLCTFGFAGRHVVRAFAKGDPRWMKSIRARFAESVYPGETLRTRMWKEGDRIRFETSVVERDKVVLSGGEVTLWDALPTAATARAPKAASAANAANAESAAKGPTTDAGAGPSGADAGSEAARGLFAAVAKYIAKEPELAGKVATKFAFRLTSPESAWVIDLRTAPGAVRAAVEDDADVTLTLADEDWVAIASGKADAQKLFFAGKLKITGNMMAAQKLSFLRKLAAPASSAAPALMEALGKRLAESGQLRDVGAPVELRLREPESVWALEPAASPPVRAGKATDPQTVLTLREEDFVQLLRGEARIDALYQHGKLRIDGELRPARALSFLSGLGR